MAHGELGIGHIDLHSSFFFFLLKLTRFFLFLLLSDDCATQFGLHSAGAGYTSTGHGSLSTVLCRMRAGDLGAGAMQ